MTAKFRRMLVVLGTVFVLVMSFAPAAFAGEDGGCDDDEGCGGGGGAQVSGGGDTGSASGGIQTGAGAMATVSPDGSMVLPFALAGGGVLVLTAASGLALRRQTSQ